MQSLGTLLRCVLHLMSWRMSWRLPGLRSRLCSACCRSGPPSKGWVHRLRRVSEYNFEAIDMKLTLDFVGTAAICVTGAIVDLRVFWWDLVAAPTDVTVGHGEDILLLLQTDKLAVAGALEVVRAVALERGAGREAADGHLRLGRQGDCGCGDGLGDDRRRGCAVVGGGAEQQRRCGEDGGESDEDHVCGDGDGVLVRG